MLGIHFGLVLTYHIGHWMWWSSCLDILQRKLCSPLRSALCFTHSNIRIRALSGFERDKMCVIVIKS